MADPKLELKTVAVREDGCFSVLLWEGRPFAVSVERTFSEGEAKHGKHIVIPAGDWWCLRDRYHKGGYDTYEVQLPEHDRVLFHKGNVEENSEACVVVAESFGILKGKTAVLDSASGFTEFMALAAGLGSFKMRVTGR